MLRKLSLLIAALAAAAALLAVEVPRKSPEYAIQMPGGKQVLLSQYRGKVVALGFYFTTCPHCVHTCQFMEKLSGELGAKGFQPLGAVFREGDNMFVTSFASSNKLTFPLAFSPRETVFNFLGENPAAYSVVPQMVIVDRQGVIRYQSPLAGDAEFFKEDVLRKKIEGLLAEGRTGKTAGKPAAKKSN